jgi:hypothetical protein
MTFDLKTLRLMLLINFGLCLLLTYKMLTMDRVASGDLAELREAFAADLDEKDRQSLLDKLFLVVEGREQTRNELRNVVLRYTVGMIPFFVGGIICISRIKASDDPPDQFGGFLSPQPRAD